MNPTRMAAERVRLVKEEWRLCHDCRAPVRYVHHVYAEDSVFNPDGARHFCNPHERTARVGDLAVDELLFRPDRPDEMVRFGGEVGSVRNPTILLLYMGDGRVTQNPCLQEEFAEAGWQRRLEIWTRPLPEPTSDTRHGLLTAEGVLYPCEYGGHRWLAGAIEVATGVLDATYTCALLKQDSWFRPTDLYGLSSRDGDEVYDWVTPAQFDVMRAWCDLHKVDWTEELDNFEVRMEDGRLVEAADYPAAARAARLRSA